MEASGLTKYTARFHPCRPNHYGVTVAVSVSVSPPIAPLPVSVAVSVSVSPPIAPLVPVVSVSVAPPVVPVLVPVDGEVVPPVPLLAGDPLAVPPVPPVPGVPQAVSAPSASV